MQQANVVVGRQNLLHVHQIELTLQNEELRQMQAELKVLQAQLNASRQKYLNLYDFAPVGYCTLDKYGFAWDVNRRAAQQLGVEKLELLNTKLYHRIVEKDQGIFSGTSDC